MTGSKTKRFLLLGITATFLVAGPAPEIANTAWATKQQQQKNETEKGNGAGLDEIRRHNDLAKQIQTVRAPARLRTNIISSLGLAGGGAVGEVATTFFTCILKCIPGVKIDYQPGDFWRKTMEGQRKIWGIEGPPKKRTGSTRPNPTAAAPKRASVPQPDDEGYVDHKLGFKYRPSRFGGIYVKSPNGQPFHVLYGGKIKVGDKTLTASIDPTGRSYLR